MKKNLLFTATGVLAGIFVFAAVRFITYKSDNVHYHANFALYINGQKDKFNGPGYYEEVQACTADDVDNPRARTHMHNENASLVHIHAHAVTWGQFFNNLGYTVGGDVVETGKGVFAEDDKNKLTFTLNGRQVESIADRVIKSEDVLLINYGNDGAKTLKERYDAIPRDAGKANIENDPGSCSGSENLTYWTRLKRAVGFNQTTH